jgi:hypothetical protein
MSINRSFAAKGLGEHLLLDRNEAAFDKGLNSFDRG